MFTGIVRALGEVVERSPHRLVVDSLDLTPAPGASVAVNGVCLTVTESRGRRMTMDLSAGGGE